MAAPAQTENRPRQRPGWMSIPGGPKEPNNQEFRTKLNALVAEKSKIYDRLKEIQARSGPRDDTDRDAIVNERKELRQRMNDIDALRKKEREARSSKNEEIARIRKQRTDIEAKLKELSNELGAFRELSDIEMAIDHIMLKMETGGGGLSSEKRTVKRLNQLEEAKSLLLLLQPLQESISVAEDQEAALQQEYREIHERIGTLNKEFEEFFTTKQSKDKEAQKTNVDRSAIIKERDEQRQKLQKVIEEMNKLREGYNAQREAWDAWRVEAMKKYSEKVEAERAERQKRWLERQNAEKIARKKARALKRQNPHEAEINACITLIRYLKDRKDMTKRDEEDRERRAKMATFDPAATAPSGFVLAAPIVLPKGGKAKAPKGEAPKDRMIQHTEAKIELFKVAGVEAPLSLSAIDNAVAALKAKQTDFEAKIKAGELVLSSDDDEEQEEGAAPAEAAAEE